MQAPAAVAAMRPVGSAAAGAMLDVWVEGDTIYSLQRWQEVTVSPDGSSARLGISRVGIDVNDGIGWTPFYETDCSVPSCTSCSLPGCPGAFLVRISDRLLCQPNAGGSEDWLWIGPGWYADWVDSGLVQHPFFVRDDLAYGLVGGPGSARVARWDGEFTDLGWWPGTFEPTGDFCTGGVFIQRMRVLDADRLVLIAGTAGPEDGPSDCMASDNAFILYWDGSTWHWV